jgi:hypothetical protein
MSGILAWRNYLFSASSNKASEGTALPLFYLSIYLFVLLLFL